MHSTSDRSFAASVLALVLTAAMCCTPSQATPAGTAPNYQATLEGPQVEQRIKAAYLYKFASYVEWPPGSFASPRSPLVIGVAGDQALRDELERLVAGKTIGDRHVLVRAVQSGYQTHDIHVIYVGALDAGERRVLRRQLDGRPVLLVSDVAQARALHSMVRFVLVDQRLRFDVDLGSVAAARLKMSALMLSAAREVQRP